MSGILRKCKRCLLPETYETLEIAADDSSCNMCRGSEFKNQNIDWEKRKNQFDSIIEKYRGKNDYDCIVPFSGGKDSTFTLYYLMKEYGIKPLVVRFNHGFYRPGHEENVNRTLRKLGVDFIDFRPNWTIVKRLMKESFDRKTDFCWHCHTGVYSFPLRIAVRFNVPLVIWGEPLSELSAYYTYEGDDIEFEDEEKFNMVRNLGITAEDMYGMISGDDFPVNRRDLLPYTYPTVEELKKLGCYSVCLGSFIPWDYRKQTRMIMDELGWVGLDIESAPRDVNGEFAKVECWLQGTRDYVKYLKRGYSRVTQLVNFEIRNGRMSSEEGQRLVEAYDAFKPASLEVFLEYMGMTEREFNETVAKFAVAPWEPDFERELPETRLQDMDSWYRENNRKEGEGKRG